MLWLSAVAVAVADERCDTLERDPNRLTRSDGCLADAAWGVLLPPVRLEMQQYVS